MLSLGKADPAFIGRCELRLGSVFIGAYASDDQARLIKEFIDEQLTAAAKYRLMMELPLDEAQDWFAKERIGISLQKTGSQMGAAEDLGMNRTTLISRMKKMALEV